MISGIKEVSYPTIGFLIVLLCFCLQGVFGLNDLILISPDSVNYMGWAGSLARLHGFASLLDAEPTSYVTNAPLYPSLLAPVALIFPSNLIVAKGVSLALALLLLALLFRFVKKQNGGEIALLLCALLAIHPAFMLFSTQVLAEVPFLLALLLTLMAYEAVVMEERSGAKSMLPLILSVVACVFLRDLGIVLAASVVIILFKRKRYKESLAILLPSVSLYLLWFLWNEGIVGGSEHPMLSNTQLLLSHVYTGSASSLTQEFLTRIRINGAAYGSHLASTLFLSQYSDWAWAVTRSGDQVLTLMRDVVSFVRLPVVACIAALVCYGAYRYAKQEATGPLVILFAVLYFVAVTVYPIVDERFLFPLLLPMLLAVGHGVTGVLLWVHSRRSSVRRVLRIGLGATLALFALPHLAWARNYVWTSAMYQRDPVGLSASFAGESEYPLGFARLLPQAADWIVHNSDSSAVVLSKYKEVSLWLQGRKIMNPDPAVSAKSFENLVRDYHPAYVVNFLEGHHWGDFDFQMASSRRFTYSPVYRVGDVEVLRVDPASAGRGSAGLEAVSDPERSKFLHAARLLSERGRESAEEALHILLQLGPAQHYSVFFYSALAAQFAGRLGEASTLYAQLRNMQQAGSYLRAAQYQYQLMDLLARTYHAASPAERAELCQAVSIGYWDLGFPGRAIDLQEKALSIDSTYPAALIYGIDYSFDLGDLGAARAYYERARSVVPHAQTVAAWTEIFDALSDTTRYNDGTANSLRQLKICRVLISIGLDDEAADRILALLQRDPGNVPALKMLAELYLRHGRRTPARWTLERLNRLTHD